MGTRLAAPQKIWRGESSARLAGGAPPSAARPPQRRATQVGSGRRHPPGPWRRATRVCTRRARVGRPRAGRTRAGCGKPAPWGVAVARFARHAPPATPPLPRRSNSMGLPDRDRRVEPLAGDCAARAGPPRAAQNRPRRRRRFFARATHLGVDVGAHRQLRARGRGLDGLGLHGGAGERGGGERHFCRGGAARLQNDSAGAPPRLANQRRFGLRAYPQPKKAKCSARTTTAPRSCLGRGGDLQSSKTANEPEGGRGLRASGRKEARHIQPPPKRSESIFVALVTPLLAPPCAVIGPSAARRRGVYAPEAPMARR